MVVPGELADERTSVLTPVRNSVGEDRPGPRAMGPCVGRVVTPPRVHVSVVGNQDHLRWVAGQAGSRLAVASTVRRALFQRTPPHAGAPGPPRCCRRV